ncbi:MAG: NAD(P)H-hydrate dehydratase [Candidatus Rokubacteria bacterium]|nr:NAD(P)H-hydrate dehydratase [Candidatus Rokubacteria bacterium]
MLPVLRAAEMREVDRRAIAALGIPGARLMEAAGQGAATLIARELGPVRGKRVVILCGKGNNGGDGFVVARALRGKGARVGVLLTRQRGEVAGDARLMLRRWRGPVTELGAADQMERVSQLLGPADLAVDALLGTGATGPPRGVTAALIETLNDWSASTGKPVASLDLPSGIDADTGAVPGPAVRARLTASFAGWKRGLLLFPAAALAGRVHIVPIGIDPVEVARGIDSVLWEEGDVRPLFPPRPRDGHKGTYGHLLIVAGSLGKTGAAGLAARAALRSGAGLVTVATAASQQPIVAGLSLEAMTEPLEETAVGSVALAARARIGELAARADAVALGPGLGLDPDTQALVRALVREVARPMVVDADALTALAGHLEALAGAPAPRVLTPHPGEMARLLDTRIEEVQADRLETVRRFAVAHRVCLLLKGAGSVVGTPDGLVSINPTGNPGMATGGAGDVLTGMTGAFLARGLPAEVALRAAVFLHGRAGDLARDERGEEGLIAGDIAEAIAGAMRGGR